MAKATTKIVSRNTKRMVNAARSASSAATARKQPRVAGRFVKASAVVKRKEGGEEEGKVECGDLEAVRKSMLEQVAR